MLHAIINFKLLLSFHNFNKFFCSAFFRNNLHCHINNSSRNFRDRCTFTKFNCFFGTSVTHNPHPMHFAASTTATPSLRAIALTGQRSSTHIPQAVQLTSLTCASIGLFQRHEDDYAVFFLAKPYSSMDNSCRQGWHGQHYCCWYEPIPAFSDLSRASIASAFVTWRANPFRLKTGQRYQK